MEPDPLWYKDAVLYELHVRAFYDSAGDGIGDFGGLTRKLDYLEDLGVTAVWLLPFYPSPLRDDGYDIADYEDVHPDYGTLPHFRAFLREAHRRGIRVITELVVNHTSDQHPWFQRARRAPPGSKERDFYVWSDTPEKYKEARIIFKDFEPSNWTWDPVAKAYYWHRFYAHQPDLNYDNPAVKEAVFRVMEKWMAMGVDGMRLDAIPYLYEREGGNCENLPEGHQFLRELRARVDRKFPGRVFVAEANQWPEDASAYFGNGDECHMNFHFPLMPRLYMALQMEDRFPIVDILQQTPPIPENCQWAMFLRNHDELTLEMVTEEERDYMWRTYARDPKARINLGIRRRLAPLLNNNRRKIELMNSLLLAMPGTPVIYYGDEIGMGDNFYLGDRNGVRTPMQWNGDRNAGFSSGNPQRLYLPVITEPEYHFESVNVEAQLNNPSSLLWWMKRLIALRKRHRAFGRGELEFLHPDNPRVLAFVRRFQDERILVVANLSRFTQAAQMDLSAHKGCVPVELFGRSRFPVVGEAPYLFTLGPHSFYWFALQAPAAPGAAAPQLEKLPELNLPESLQSALEGDEREAIEALLPDFLRRQRWFGAKSRTIQHAQIREALPVELGDQGRAALCLVQVAYAESEAQMYQVPLMLSFGAAADKLREQHRHGVLAAARVRGRDDLALLHDAAYEPAFPRALLVAMARQRSAGGWNGRLHASSARLLREAGQRVAHLPATVLAGEQSNTSFALGQRFVLKLFRRVDEGVNPDFEVSRFLSEQVGFPHAPPFAGALEYRAHGHEHTLGVLHGFVANEGDAWSYTLGHLDRYFEQVVSRRGGYGGVGAPPVLPAGLLDRSGAELSAASTELVGGYLEAARLLGQRTAALHIALASETADPAFAPEPFGALYQRGLYQSMRNLAGRTLQNLNARLSGLAEPARSAAAAVLARRDAILNLFRALTNRPITAWRIRIHGDYHLGQVLWTGKDFVILDFEGEVTRPIGERRIKRNALRDVVAMLRSFNYATHAAQLRQEKLGVVPASRLPQLEPWGRHWNDAVTGVFLRAYLAQAGKSRFLPQAREELEALLALYQLERALYEVGYEMDHRPDWLQIPLQGILQLLQDKVR
ncbi:MAG: maltose alpha-D-glucosyltransferase [Planctomycetota bacterium]|nr:MAG: maltose alpha-D-glucosyltransferase [Planctomycetota bacterium]